MAYQVCWQRILFFSFGTDIESTTIIVSVFMLGLGIGSLMGGWATDRWPEKIIQLFAMFELGIGLFGLISPTLIVAVSDFFILARRETIAAVNFLILLLPTALMGATLPMLITFSLRTYKNIGVSTGSLYFLNTLGAAVGCGLTGFIGFKVLTLKGVITLAACINILIAGTVFVKFRRHS